MNNHSNSRVSVSSLLRSCGHKIKASVFRGKVVRAGVQNRDIGIGRFYDSLFDYLVPIGVRRRRVNLMSFRHYFNDILFTSWPFYIGGSTALLFFYVVVFIKKFAFIVPVMLLLPIMLLLFYMANWFDELTIDGRLYGRYNRKIRSCFTSGFLCFLISEVLLFGGFF